MKKIIFISFALLFNSFNCFSQAFSNSTVSAAGSWNGTLTKTVTVSGLSNLNAGIFELVQVNLHMGDDGNTRNYNTYRITLTKGTTSIDLVSTGGLPNSQVKQINTKFRYNPYLRRLFEHGGTAEPFSIGYYRSQDNYSAFNGIDPNGVWTINITETSTATGGRFNKVDLIFKSPFTVQDYTTLNSYDNCSTPYCLGNAEIIVASNNGFTNQAGDMFDSNTASCSWNGAQNNSAWFKFRAAQSNVKVTISAITGKLQILAIDAGADENPCTPADNIVLTGGCPTLSSNDTYSSPQYTNGSTKNNQLNLSGLTIGKFYYFIVDGEGASVSPFYIETTGTSLNCSNCQLNAVVGTNSPVCENQSLNLTCNDGVSWAWTGPNGFTSSSQNPTINNVTQASAGTYTVVVTDINGCSDTKSINVVISTSVTPTFNIPSPVCLGSTLNPLPTTSNNGIQGEWSPALNNSATTIYTFTPNPGQCASTTTLTITVNNCDFGAYASAVWMDDCTDLGDNKFYNTTGGGADLINQEPGNTFIKDFGVHVENSSTLILRGAEVKTYKNGGTNVCGSKMYYRYYLTSSPPGTFISRNLFFFSDCNTGISEFINGGGPCVAGQQKWQCVSQPGCDTPVNLTLVPPGDYTLEVYYDVTGDFNSTTQCDDTIILNNGGTNYKANFSIIALPTLSNTNPTTCNGTNGTITISGLKANDVYAVSYQFNSSSIGPNNFTSNSNGQIIISNLGVGNYSNFSFVINSCTTVLTSSVTLQNPVITPVFSTPNPYCYGANVPSTVLPSTSNNGITGSWLPAINNTATTTYTFTPDPDQCATTTNLTVFINLEITGTTNTNPNTVCNASSTNCLYTGPIAFINEVMYMPGTNFSTLGGDNTNAAFQSLYNNTNTGQEWIEIYNPNPCISLDLGCYVLGSDTSSSNSGAFSFPSGTTIPPLGFLTIGAGPNVNINLHDYIGTSSLIGSNRWHLENGCGYILLANPSGVIVDAIYWSQNNTSDLTASTSCGNSFNRNLNIPNQCNPAINPLPKARDITNVVYAGNFGATAQGSANIGRTISRITDGANTFVISPQLGGTPGNCNGVCTPPFSGGSTCNGSASVTITQGSGNYSYLWNDAQAQTTATANNLCAGNYCVTVTDLDTNCTQQFCVTVGDDTLIPVLATLTSITPICSGGNAVFALSGTANATVTYTINTGAPQTVVLDANGNATVTVNSVTTNTTILLSQISLGTCNATISNTVTVAVNSTPVFGNLTATTPICSGGNAVFTLSGTANATVTYTINTGAPQTVVLDANGNATVTVNSVTTNTTILLSQISLGTCNATISNTVTVAVNPLPTFGNLTATTPICSGGNAVFTLSGTANATVTYTINTGAPQTVVLDANGNATVTVNSVTTNTTILLSQISLGTCNETISNTVTVAVNSTPVFGNLTATTPICSGGNAVFTLSGTANATVTYTINTGAPQTVVLDANGNATVTVNSVTTNTTILLSQISLGTCNATISNTVTVAVNPLPTFGNLTSTTPICSGGNAVFTLSGTANATVTYTINTGAPQTVVLDANGNATVTVNSVTTNTTILLSQISLGNCNATISNTVTVAVNPLPIFGNLTATTPICSGGNAVFALSGTVNATVTYTINTGAPQTVVLDANGNATVTVNSVTTNTTILLSQISLGTCNATISNTVTVAVNPLPTFGNLTSTTPICSGGNAVFTLSGTANATVTYTINTGAPQTVVLDANGNATVTVNSVTTNTTILLSQISLGNCNATISNTVTVAVNPLPTFGNLTSTTPICSGGNAVFTLSGTANATVTYTINTGAPQTVVLDANGNATVTVNSVTTNTTILLSQISLGNCNATISNTVTVAVNSTPVFGNLTATTPICSGGNAVFTLSGTANATVTYTINTGAPQTVVLDANGNATVTVNSVTTNTTILLSQISLGNCNATISNNATVAVNSTPIFGNLTATTPICSGGNAVFALSGTVNATVTYTINTGAPQTVVLDANGNATVTVNSVTTNTTILLSQINLGTCNAPISNTLTVTVTQKQTPTFGFGTSLPACQGVSAQVLLPTTSDNSITGSWNPSTIDYSIVGPTVYTFTPNSGQCAFNTTLTVTVNTIPQFTISGGCDGEDYVLQIAQQSQNVTNVKWYFNNVLIGQGTSIIISDEGLYTAVVTNANNCQSDADINVTNSFCSIPKGVSANNDDLNDFFELSNLDVKKLQIFNRYGMLIYTKNNYTNEWGGQSDTGDQVPDGTYYYVIEQRSGKVKSGWVYLIRQR